MVCLHIAASYSVSFHRSCIWSPWPWLSVCSQPSRFQHSHIGKIWVPSPCFWCSLGESFGLTKSVDVVQSDNVSKMLLCMCAPVRIPSVQYYTCVLGLMMNEWPDIQSALRYWLNKKFNHRNVSKWATNTAVIRRTSWQLYQASY